MKQHSAAPDLTLPSASSNDDIATQNTMVEADGMSNMPPAMPPANRYMDVQQQPNINSTTNLMNVTQQSITAGGLFVHLKLEPC